jgi:polygalacturonase
VGRACSGLTAREYWRRVPYFHCRSGTDNVVLVPAGMNFTIFPVLVTNVSNIVLQVDGGLHVNNNLNATQWTSRGGDYGVLELHSSTNIEITGSGVYDGIGYRWCVVLCLCINGGRRVCEKSRATVWLFVDMVTVSAPMLCDRWWAVFLTAQDYRPHLVVMRQCQNVLIHNLRFINSPQYHIFINDGVDYVIR